MAAVTGLQVLKNLLCKLAAYLNLQANRKWRKNIWENSIDLSYALINTNTTGFRKTDDKIDFVSMFRHSITKKDNKVGIGAWFNVRTQFHDGYDYTETPKRRISGLMAPGYLTLGPGFDIRTKKCKPFCFTCCSAVNSYLQIVLIVSITRVE